MKLKEIHKCSGVPTGVPLLLSFSGSVMAFDVFKDLFCQQLRGQIGCRKYPFTQNSQKSERARHVDMVWRLLFCCAIMTLTCFREQAKSVDMFPRTGKPVDMFPICQLVLEGMLLTTDSGEYKLATFIKPELMSKLYEKFILEYYNQEHKELDASASQIPWGLDDGIDAMLPVMQTDITLTKGEKTLIIDAKYYSSTLQQHYDRMTIYSNNLYQIFTYVKNKEVELKDKPHKISGMLLYAKTDEETYPDNDYKMSGNRIGVHTLDLNVEFPQIREQLDGIAARYLAYASAISSATHAE